MAFIYRNPNLASLEKSENDLKKFDTKPTFIWQKSSKILSDYIGYTFHIYIGNRFKSITVTSSMVGFSFGEFVLTRKPLRYRTLKKKKKNK